MPVLGTGLKVGGEAGGWLSNPEVRLAIASERYETGDGGPRVGFAGTAFSAKAMRQPSVCPRFVPRWDVGPQHPAMIIAPT